MTWAPLPRSEAPGGLVWHTAGAGAPILLLHGVGLRAEAWGALMPLLTRRFSVYAVDLPGHGHSPPLDGARPAVPDFAERVIEALAVFESPVGIVGHSLGALVAVEIAARRAGRVAALAALNAIDRRTPDAARAVRKRARRLASEQDPDPAPTLARWFGDDPRGGARDARDACREWLTGADRAGYAAAYGAFADSDGPAADSLASIRCPALFLTGADDPNSTPAMSEALAGAVAGARAVVVPGAAHMLPMTHPTAVARALTALFESQETIDARR